MHNDIWKAAGYDCQYTPGEEKTIAVLEPNLNMTKNCIPSIFIVEELMTQHGELFKQLIVYCSSQIRDKNYFKAAEQLIKATKPIEDDLLDTLKNNRSKPRIPFGSLVELGIIKPGTNIFDNKKKITARIMADGSIKHNQAEGSIHKVAATILGAESCNGWTFWHCDINGRTYPIDYLRQRLISKN